MDERSIWSQLEKILARVEGDPDTGLRIWAMEQLGALLLLPGGSEELRTHILDCIQLLARRRAEESACCRGLETMRERFRQRHG